MTKLNPHHELTPILRNKVVFNLLNTTLGYYFSGIIVKNNLVSIIFNYYDYILQFEYNINTRQVFILVFPRHINNQSYLAVFDETVIGLDEFPHLPLHISKYDKKTAMYINNKYGTCTNLDELATIYIKFYNTILKQIEQKIKILLNPTTKILFKIMF